MKIKEIEIENILSIEKAKLSFEDSGLVLVEGWNHDDGRANGAGKTAIFNCMAFALFNKLPRKVTASEILRRGASRGKSTVTVECGTDVWTVERSRPSGVVFHKNGVPVDCSQEEWEAVLRISYNQFLMSMYCAQNGDSTRFLLTPDAEKKKFLLQLLNLDVFTNAKKAADLKIKGLETDLTKVKEEKGSLESKMDAYSESLIDENVYHHHINLNNAALQKLNEEYHTLSQVSKPDTAKYLKLEEDIRIKQNEFSSTRTKRQLLHDKFRELNSELIDYDPNQKCSECGSSLDNDNARKSHANHQEKLKVKIADVKKQIDDCDLILAKEKSIRDLASKLRDKKTSESEEYDMARNRITELTGHIREKNKDVNNLCLKLESNAELLNKIKTLGESLEVHRIRASAISADLELYKTIANIYSPTGAQAYILDSVIDFFNEAVQKYIAFLWPNASYTLTSYRENVKGELTAKFSEILTMGGSEVSVGSLSGGELKALSLCVDFGILDVLESQFGIALNPIVLDEPFDGLDTTGREIVVELLEKLATTRQIFVIDHASEAKSMFSKVIRVEKKNGLSSIIVES